MDNKQDFARCIPNLLSCHDSLTWMTFSQTVDLQQNRLLGQADIINGYLFITNVCRANITVEIEDGNFSFDMLVTMFVVIWKCVVYLKYK